MTHTADIASPGAQTFRNRLMSARLFPAYMAAKMPLGALAGLKMEQLDGHQCSVSVPYGWRTKNPFGSIYFAALSMAAELSCAGLALMASRAPQEKVAVYPIGLKGDFIKQAKAKTTFTCTQGAELFAGVRRAVETGEAVTVVTTTVGLTDEGLIVSKFDFTWSYKKKT
jgi:acyl-coenzyme A thioesterase PaaI-like protein